MDFDIVTITIIMFASMVGFLTTGRQIFFIVGSVGTISALALWGQGGVEMTYLGAYSYLKWNPLLALPPFVLMGYLLASSGVADELYDAIYIWMGRIPGGLAVGTVAMCALIAAMSGLSFAATVSAGTISLPAMLKRKYDKRMITGVIAAGGALGFLIPPSVVFILYGMIARVSIGSLWIAGIIPGFLLAVLYITYILVRCHYQPSLGPPLPLAERKGMKAKIRATKSALLPIILIFVVLGLLFMGVTSLNESAAIGAIGALGCAFANKRFSWKLFREATRKSFVVTVMIMWIIVTAILFGSVFDGLGAVNAMEKLLNMMPGGNWGILIAMQLSFMGLGTILDDTAMLLIVAPLYIPLVGKMGFDLVWYGVLYVINCQMAYITPPFGYNLFIMKAIVPKEITMGDIYRSIIPFVGIQALCLVLVMVFPQLALWLPSVFHPKIG